MPDFIATSSVLGLSQQLFETARLVSVLVSTRGRPKGLSDWDCSGDAVHRSRTSASRNRCPRGYRRRPGDFVQQVDDIQAESSALFGTGGFPFEEVERHLPEASIMTGSSVRPISAAHCSHWRHSSFLALRTKPPKSAARLAVGEVLGQAAGLADPVAPKTHTLLCASDKRKA